MHIRYRLHIYLLVVVALSFWMGSPPAVADDAADRQAIEAAARQWIKAFNDRDAPALAALTTEDVMVLAGPSRRIAGSKNARDVWLRVASLAGADAKSVSKEIVVSGGVAWRVGAVMYRRSGGEPHTSESLEIWKRTGDGWKLHRQMSSLITDLLPRPAPSQPVLDRPSD